MTRVLFVCLGNICRSPSAEGVFRTQVSRAGRDAEIEVDSAGTGAWHVGSPPDERSIAAARSRGYELGGCARQVERADFDRFDVIVAMDRTNLANLRRLAPDQAAQAKLRLLLGDADVPDPYAGGPDGFEHVLDLLEDGCARLLAEL